MFSKVSLFAVALLCVTAAGCNRLPATVSGVVRLDKEPLTTGTVTFHPDAGGPAAYGTIDAAGHYEIKTGARGGMALGDYAITVIANAPIDAKILEAANNSPIDPIGELLVPPKYLAKQTSGLRATVKEGNNVVDLELSK